MTASATLMTERSITCPSCRVSVGITLDLSVPEQQNVEDCAVCCRPIAIRCSTDGGERIELHASAEYEA